MAFASQTKEVDTESESAFIPIKLGLRWAETFLDNMCGNREDVFILVPAAAVGPSALDANSAAHQLDEPARDGEAESRAAIVAGRRALRLLEFVEDHTHLFGRQATAAVLDFKEKSYKTRLRGVGAGAAF